MLAMPVFELIGSLERATKKLVSGPARTTALGLARHGNISLSLRENPIFISNHLLQHVPTTCERGKILNKISDCSELPRQFSVLF